MSAGSGEERKAENTGVDADDQAWYESRPDVQEALRGSLDKSTWLREESYGNSPPSTPRPQNRMVSGLRSLIAGRSGNAAELRRSC